MKCKSCGGELFLQDGLYLCKSCGATFALDSVYEKIDAYICYEESDIAGRRTKDSIVAQEVYRKLEENKIATFYERISADGMIGDDLETSKRAAIRSAKIIIVLGTSAERFASIEKKYIEFFEGKTVIPFCVDVNPNVIPNTLSKIQAVNYSTIGWDKDLAKGIYNLLGRKQDVDTKSLYTRSKVSIVIIGAIILLLAGIIAASLWLLLPTSEPSGNTDSLGINGAIGEEDTKETEDPTVEPTVKPLTQKEIYDNANELLSQDDLIGALELFSQIPDYPNSANMIKKIYSNYEGYYLNDANSLYLDITDNISAAVEVSIAQASNKSRFSLTTSVACDIVEGVFQDNLQQIGKITLKLENAGISLHCSVDGKDNNTELFFKLSERSDKPLNTIDVETLLSLLKKKTTISQARTMGFEITGYENWQNRFVRCMIKDTDIHLNASVIENEIYEIGAPAEVIASSYIGKKCAYFFKGDFLYLVNYDYYEGDFCVYGGVNLLSSKSVIEKDTPILVTSKKCWTTEEWNNLLSDLRSIK